MQDQHTKISGYRDLSQAEIDMMNKIKAHANVCGELVEELKAMSASKELTEIGQPDGRWVSIGATDLQTGFMALVRSIDKPTGF